MFCPNCGKENGNEEKLCTGCGTMLKKEEVELEAGIEEVAIIPQEEQLNPKEAAKQAKDAEKQAKAAAKEAEKQAKEDERAAKEAAKQAEIERKLQAKAEKAALFEKNASKRKVLNAISVVVATISVICMFMSIITVGVKIDTEEMIDSIDYDKIIDDEVKKANNQKAKDALEELRSALDKNLGEVNYFEGFKGELAVDLSFMTIADNLDALNIDVLKEEVDELKPVVEMSGIIHKVVLSVLMLVVLLLMVALILTSCQSGKTYIFTLLTSLMTFIIGAIPAILVGVSTVSGISDILVFKATVYLYILVAASVVNVIFVAIANRWMK